MIRVGFALLSPSKNPIPSTRIACLNIFPLLEYFGYKPSIIFEPIHGNEKPDVSGLVERVLAEGIPIVVFQKIHGASVLEAVRQLRLSGVKTVYCVCDVINNEMAAETDATIVVTDYLKSLHAPHIQDRIHVVHDGIEYPEQMRHANNSYANQRLTASLVTSHPLFSPPLLSSVPAGWRINIIGAFPPASASIERLRTLRWQLNEEHSWRKNWQNISAFFNPLINHIKWHPQSVYDQLCKADIGIIPIDTTVDSQLNSPAWKVKSENRLTLKMAIGLPVIATPIPAYENVIDHGINGYFARSSDDWKCCFKNLRDPELRLELGKNARSSVLDRFSKSRQAERFAHVLQMLIKST